ncbi:MAG TPA: acyl-CoA synthetase [Steroidobacteraceae bacterium]|nr:acyl-CoA synthetase [Steroidobacteraceae bacterium]
MNGIASQADVLAIEARGLPADLPSSTYEMIRAGAALDPAAPALSFFLRTCEHRRAERWTYRDFLRDITRTANMFHRLGVRRESMVAYVLPNLPETHLVIWGGEATGIVFAINPLLESSAIAELLNAVAARVLVTLGPFPGSELWPKVRSILDSVPTLEQLLLVDLADRVQGARHAPASLLQRQESERPHGRGAVRNAIPRRIEVHDFGQAMARESGDELDSRRQFDPQDFSSCFCTGGTTGRPKIAMRRHGHEVANAWSTAQFLGDGIGPGKSMFCGLPLFHVNSVLVSGLVPFSKGAHVLLGAPQGYRTEGLLQHFWEIIEHHGINFFAGVPTLYSSLLDVPLAGHDVSSLEYGLCGAAPLPVEVLRSFEERTGIRILEGYGLTEGVCVSSCNPPLGERRPGSIGLRLPCQAMKPVVLDEADRYVRDCAIGEIGVLAISGPNVFAGYTRAEQNDRLWIDLGDGQRWLNTGDLGRCDAQGYFWLTGRRKDLIIRGGHNIDPASIEEPLHRHPAVQLGAAVGRPDVHAGEVPVVYVQLRPDATTTAQQLLEFLRSEISERAAMPKHLRIIPVMPLTGVGKIFKPELRRREITDALQSALAEVGVQCTRVSLNDNESSAISLHVEGVDPAFESRAREILGRFPFTFSIRTVDLPASGPDVGFRPSSC